VLDAYYERDDEYAMEVFQEQLVDQQIDFAV
jgi:hypothetical protein